MRKVARVLAAVVTSVGLTLAGCESIERATLERSALSDEIRNETRIGVPLPSGCPTLTLTLAAGKTSVSVSYREPTNTASGQPLSDLDYTTIYLSQPNEKPRAIRVWTKDPRGGAQVTIRDIPVSHSDIGLCVTATNWAAKESPVRAEPAAAKY